MEQFFEEKIFQIIVQNNDLKIIIKFLHTINESLYKMNIHTYY